TPICSVQFSAEISAIGCKFFRASFAPKSSGLAWNSFPSPIRSLIQTSFTFLFRQSVNKLTLYPLASISSKCAFSASIGRVFVNPLPRLKRRLNLQRHFRDCAESSQSHHRAAKRFAILLTRELHKVTIGLYQL